MNRLLKALPAPLALAALLGAAARVPAQTEDQVELDRGSFEIYQDDRLLGTEIFAFVSHGDSLLVTSRSFQVLPNGDTLRKDVAQVLGLYDYGLRSYRSKQHLEGHVLARALRLGDTTLTSERQLDGGGEVDQYPLPPGRMFVMDPKMFVCFDLVCRSLHGKAFDRRPLTLFVMGLRDTTLELTATDAGSESIRWGARAIQARRLEIGDERLKFVAWASPSGRMLRLAEAVSGLRVERQAAAVKPRAPRLKPRPAG